MNTAVIVAAGRGERMGSNTDKLFFEVAGLPIVAHTWRRMDAIPSIAQIIMVVREGMEPAFEELAGRLNLQTPWRLVRGGKERQDSVHTGASASSAATEIVLIHDGARPCLTAQLVDATIAAARRTGAAVAAQRVTDTVKESDDDATISSHLDRRRLWSVQTPQTFRREVILKALEEVKRRQVLVTDDTAACEFIGQPVAIVECPTPNPKATVPADLPYLGLLLNEAAP